MFDKRAVTEDGGSENESSRLHLHVSLPSTNKFTGSF